VNDCIPSTVLTVLYFDSKVNSKMVRLKILSYGQCKIQIYAVINLRVDQVRRCNKKTPYYNNPSRKKNHPFNQTF
jgi:hypothetical protein